MKELDFQEYTASYEDSDGDKHESTVRAAVIRKDDVYYEDKETGNRHTREVVTPTGSRKVQEGDVFVETDRPGVYDYLTADAWKGTGYGSKSASKKASSSTSSDKSDDKSGDKSDESSRPAKKAVPSESKSGHANS